MPAAALQEWEFVDGERETSEGTAATIEDVKVLPTEAEKTKTRGGQLHPVLAQLKDNELRGKRLAQKDSKARDCRMPRKAKEHRP